MPMPMPNCRIFVLKSSFIPIYLFIFGKRKTRNDGNQKKKKKMNAFSGECIFYVLRKGSESVVRPCRYRTLCNIHFSVELLTSSKSQIKNKYFAFPFCCFVSTHRQQQQQNTKLLASVSKIQRLFFAFDSSAYSLRVSACNPIKPNKFANLRNKQIIFEYVVGECVDRIVWRKTSVSLCVRIAFH